MSDKKQNRRVGPAAGVKNAATIISEIDCHFTPNSAENQSPDELNQILTTIDPNEPGADWRLWLDAYRGYLELADEKIRAGGGL